jgi:hypothetical protein
MHADQTYTVMPFFALYTPDSEHRETFEALIPLKGH